MKMERSARYLNDLEHDRSEPRFTTILLLADAIGMEPGELVDAAARLTWAAYEEEEAGATAPEEEKTAPKRPAARKTRIKGEFLSAAPPPACPAPRPLLSCAPPCIPS